MKWFMLLPLTAALAVATSAAAPAGAPPPRPRPLFEQVGTTEFEPLLRASGMSVAGIAALRGGTADAPRTEALHLAECAVEKAGTAVPLDVAALDQALAQRDALAAQAAERHRVALVGWLKRLDGSDAAVLLKLIGTGDEGGPHGGPPQGGPGGPGGPPPGERHARGSDGPPPGPPPGGPPASRCA